MKLLWKENGKKKNTDRYQSILDKLAQDNQNESSLVQIEDLTTLLTKFVRPKTNCPRLNEGVMVTSQSLESSVYSNLITPALEEVIYQPPSTKNKRCRLVEGTALAQNVKEDRKLVQNDGKDVFGVISDLKHHLDISS